jgi:hypothetical protein
MSISPVSSNSLLTSAALHDSATGANQNTNSTKAVNSSPAPTISTRSTRLAKDMNSLRWDMTSGNTPAAKADVKRVQADLLAEQASVPSSNTLGSPLDISVDSISDSLSDGSAQVAPNSASHQGMNGSGTGDLINTSA